MSASALCSPAVLSAADALRAAQQASRNAARAVRAAKAAEVAVRRVFLAAAAVEGAFPPELVAEPDVAEPTYEPIRHSPAAQLLRKRRLEQFGRAQRIRYGACPVLAHLVECDRLRAVAWRAEQQRLEEEKKQEKKRQEQEYDTAAHLLHRLEDTYPMIVPGTWVEESDEE
jgi:hypothetical protein